MADNRIIDEILGRLDIIDVISEYLSVKKTGNNYKALCPFHNEKTPSFVISPHKQIFHCFGCGEGGNVLSFVSKYEGISFFEVLKKYALKFNIAFEYGNTNNKDGKTKEKLRALLTDTAVFYNKFLKNSHAEKALEYFKSRNITETTIKDFMLGFAPESWDTICSLALKKGYSRENLINSGIVVENSAKKSFYDRFRGRIIFPIDDIMGNTIGFGARVLDESLPKYVNSPESSLFNKSKNLYGLYKAKRNIINKDTAIIVEGYFDCLRAHQDGVDNVVATLGTALTINHTRILKRFTNNIIMIYDSDNAGIKAVLKNIDILLEQDLNVFVVALLRAKDPDEFILQFGVEEFKKVINTQKLSFFDFKLNCLKKDFDIKSESGKAEIAKSMFLTIRRIKDNIIIDEYLKKISIELNIRHEVLISQFKQGKELKTKKQILFNNLKNQVKETAVQNAEKKILRIVLENEKYYSIIKSLIEEYDIKFQNNLLKMIWDIYNQEGFKSGQIILTLIDKDELKNELSLLMIESDDIEDKERILKDCIFYLILDEIKNQKKEINNLLKIFPQDQEKMIIKKELISKENKIREKGVALW